MSKLECLSLPATFILARQGKSLLKCLAISQIFVETPGIAWNIRLGWKYLLFTTFSLRPPTPRGGIRTLDLRTITLVFYHCATEAGQAKNTCSGQREQLINYQSLPSRANIIQCWRLFGSFVTNDEKKVFFFLFSPGGVGDLPTRSIFVLPRFMGTMSSRLMFLPTLLLSRLFSSSLTLRTNKLERLSLARLFSLIWCLRERTGAYSSSRCYGGFIIKLCCNIRP